MLTFKLYQACQNNFLIVNIESDFNWSENRTFRKTLSILGKKYLVDSVLIIKGNPWKLLFPGVHCSMEVYEPHADSISTMCGNGIRAVCQYWVDLGFIPQGNFKIGTGSGVREVTYIKDFLFKADMGLLTLRKKDFQKYVAVNKLIVNNEEYLEDIYFSENTALGIKNEIKIIKAIIGLTGNENDDRIDGEPHLIFFLKNKTISLEQLEEYTNQVGKVFTHNTDLFPQEINTSLVIQNTSGISICTYERGVYYVTKSCGTASTVAGGYLLNNAKKQMISVDTLGGHLKVELGPGKKIFLTGNASKIINSPLEFYTASA